MKVFDELGNKVEERWKAVEYDEELLPSIAKSALEEADVPSKTDPWEIIEWTLAERELPAQRDLPSNFGDPAITLYSSARFHVDVYFWFDGTTSVHRHGFCGAFQVLHGSSIHSWYEFETRKRLNRFTEIGEMKLKLCELLNVGDIQEIWSGKRYIHSLFHLDRPSATIVIRTHRSPLHPPQLNYHKPCLGIDPFFEEPNTIKKIQAAAALLRAERPDADDLLESYLRGSDFQTCFNILNSLKGLVSHDAMRMMFNVEASSDRFGKLLDVVAKEHPEEADVLPAVFDYAERLGRIIRQRSYVTDPELRFFLALVLNVEGRDNILTLITERFPDVDPVEKILDWVEALAGMRVMGAGVSNALGIEGFDDADLLILENLLKGMDDDQAKREFIESHGGDDPDAPASTDERIARLRAADVFTAFFK